MKITTIARPVGAGAWMILALAAGLWVVGCAGSARPGDANVTPPSGESVTEAEQASDGHAGHDGDAGAHDGQGLEAVPESGHGGHGASHSGHGSDSSAHGLHGSDSSAHGLHGSDSSAHGGHGGASHGGHGGHGGMHGGDGGHGASHSAPTSPVTETKIGADGRVTIARPEWISISAKAREQIAEVERAVAEMDTPAKARAAGFRPALGMIPTMGVHWVSMTRMQEGANLLVPDHLLFSPVNGEQRLVGVAYAFMGGIEDAPDLFDGRHDVWHEHAELALPGQALVMLHLWFVPSPAGPFAGHNPLLAYWAAAVQPPPASAFHDAASAPQARRLALALAEAVEPMAFARLIPSGSELSAGLESRRQMIRAAIPRLNDARLNGDLARWNREADTAIAEWEKIRDMYLEAVPMDQARDRLASFYSEMETGGH